MRHINDAGIALIKEFEGLRLKAYRDPVGIWTVGYGHVGREVGVGLTITEEQAEGILKADLARFEAIVEAATKGYETSDNQFSAMVSLCYNIGPGNPASAPPKSGFLTSTVLKRHKLGNYVGAARAFEMWVRAGGKILPGLIRRREAEAKLYLS